MCGLVPEHRRETFIKKHFIPYDIRVENQNNFISQILTLDSLLALEVCLCTNLHVTGVPVMLILVKFYE